MYIKITGIGWDAEVLMGDVDSVGVVETVAGLETGAVEECK